MPTSPIRWAQITVNVLKRDGPLCGCCGERPAAQRHHAIIRRDVHKWRVLDTEINIQMVCPDCHATGRCDSKENRRAHVERMKGLGLDVDGWLNSLPYKTRPTY